MEHFEKYDKCDHFVITCCDDYDWYEGTHDYGHGCIKCKLCNGGPFYENYMLRYFEQGGKLDGWWSKLNFSFGKYSCYEISFGRAVHLYEEISAKNPNISNKELYEILKVKSEEYKKFDTEPKKEGIGRLRRVNRGNCAESSK